MPNWCANETIIKGTAEEIQEFLTIANYQGGTIPTLCEPFIPRPESDDKPEFDWYNWSVENWGSKWSPDVNWIELSEDGTRLFLNYDSAWSPITQFWKTISERFKSFKIDNRYVEEGMAYMGQEIIQDGATQAEAYEDIYTEHYVKAGATLDENGYVDWNVDQDYDLWQNFPLIEEEN